MIAPGGLAQSVGRAAGRAAGRALGLAALLLASAAGAQDAAPGRGRVVADSFWSPALGTHKRFLVYLPPSYGREPERRFAVAYYLHGLWGAEDDWTRQGRLAETADSLAARGGRELLLVMPDGDDGWYTTWHTLGTADACRADTTRTEPAATYCVPWARYDDYVARDLVARVDSAYRTHADRAHRGVAGLSMGGYGAVSLALRYPDVFAAAASHSGVLSPLLASPAPYAPPARWAPDVATLRARWRGTWTTVPLAFGRDTAAWWARDPVRLATRTAGPFPALFVDVGVDDFVLDQNRAFRDRMRDADLPITYREWPGAHTWTYWRAHAAESLTWLGTQLEP